MEHKWPDIGVQEWIESQAAIRPWYQTIPIRQGIETPGKVNSMRRLAQMELGDLTGKTVLDIGCNSGMYSFECKKRNAGRVVGIDLDEFRLSQAHTINGILQMDVIFLKKSIYDLSTLGTFNIVICVAVITEIENIIAGLLTLKEIAEDELYLELDIAPRGWLNSFSPLRMFSKRHSKYYGTAKLRKIKLNEKIRFPYALSPDWQMLRKLMGDRFRIIDLGPSERYRLLKLVKRS